METLRLYRGIAVSESKSDLIVEEIRANGLYQSQSKEKQWEVFIWKDLRNNIDDLYGKKLLTRNDTSPASIWVATSSGGHLEYTEGETGICFADKVGAEYYATKHNVTKEHQTPILITVDLNIGDIAIDGRDFLYTIFGFIDPKDLNKTRRQTEKLKKIFGYKIEKYVEKIIKHSKSDKSAICDLAIIDNEVIIEYAKNQHIIGGRCGTKFKSTFFGRVPIPSRNIINIEKISDWTRVDPKPDITLNDILER